MAEHYIKAAGIGAYVCALREAERSGATIEKYARELRRFGVWLGGRAVTKETVIEYKAELAQRYAPASVNCMLAALNGYFSYCSWGECRVKPLRIQRALYRDAGREMSRAEYARLVAAAQAKREFEAAGFPTLLLDGDGCDSRNVTDGQMATRVGAFLELLEGQA